MKEEKVKFSGQFLADYSEGYSIYGPGEYVRWSAYKLDGGGYGVITDYTNNVDGHITREIATRYFNSLFDIECSEYYPEELMSKIEDKLGLYDYRME